MSTLTKMSKFFYINYTVCVIFFYKIILFALQTLCLKHLLCDSHRLAYSDRLPTGRVSFHTQKRVLATETLLYSRQDVSFGQFRRLLKILLFFYFGVRHYEFLLTSALEIFLLTFKNLLKIRIHAYVKTGERF